MGQLEYISLFESLREMGQSSFSRKILRFYPSEFWHYVVVEPLQKLGENCNMHHTSLQTLCTQTF